MTVNKRWLNNFWGRLSRHREIPRDFSSYTRRRLNAGPTSRDVAAFSRRLRGVRRVTFRMLQDQRRSAHAPSDYQRQLRIICAGICQILPAREWRPRGACGASIYHPPVIPARRHKCLVNFAKHSVPADDLGAPINWGLAPGASSSTPIGWHQSLYQWNYSCSVSHIFTKSSWIWTLDCVMYSKKCGTCKHERATQCWARARCLLGGGGGGGGGGLGKRGVVSNQPSLRTWHGGSQPSWPFYTDLFSNVAAISTDPLTGRWSLY